MPIITKLFFSPVKSLSFQNTSECEIIKNVGIKNDRLIAFTRNADLKKSKIGLDVAKVKLLKVEQEILYEAVEAYTGLVLEEMKVF